MMMIARLKVESVESQVVITRPRITAPGFLPLKNSNELAGAIRRVMNRSSTGRSRKS